MKKYFVKETGEELKEGDIVEVSLYKELEDGDVERTVECKVDLTILDLLLRAGIVEGRNVSAKKQSKCKTDDLLDFDCSCTWDFDDKEDIKDKALEIAAAALDSAVKELETLKKHIAEKK